MSQIPFREDLPSLTAGVHRSVNSAENRRCHRRRSRPKFQMRSVNDRAEIQVLNNARQARVAGNPYTEPKDANEVDYV